MFFGIYAVITVFAIILEIFFSEIMQQQLAAANGAFGIGCGFFKQLLANLLFCERLAFHELLEFLKVFVRIESDALPFAPVAPGATRFLVLAFKALGNVVVDNEANVGLVNAHAEGNRGNNHVDALHDEVVLRLRAHGGLHAGMIGFRLDVVGA